ncbi:hypothetical protein [Clostridium botulinum]|uniref:hypothetical protein n=1 Tax=Clostridium botulinum TaxID=1491 RepID=UPI001968030C|nr:hypothetical protein [Clostridium botulinum]
MAKLKAKKIIDAINKGISANPTEINIKQIKKIEVDGGFENVEIKKNLKVIIYLEDSSNKIVVDSKTQGTSYSSNKYKMLADKDADIEVSPKETIRFKCLEGNMKIEATYPIVVENIVCGYLCDLERYD